jgi:hypothetical protein
VRTYGLYRNRFRTFFLIAFPPALLAYVCSSLHLQRVLFRMIRDAGLLPQWGSPKYWATLTIIALFEGALYWLISGFFFAGIASNVLRDSGRDEPLLSDAFSIARQRPGAIAAATLVIWAAFAVSREVVALVLMPIIQRVGALRNWAVLTIVIAAMLLLVSGLISRMGLAIPILVDNPAISARQALRLSLVKTEDWEPFFILFLAKSAIIGYAAYWIVNLGLNNLAERGMLREEAFPWVQAVLYVCLAVILESPLFIAFSLLYRDSKITAEEAVPAVVG